MRRLYGFALYLCCMLPSAGAQQFNFAKLLPGEQLSGGGILLNPSEGTPDRQGFCLALAFAWWRVRQARNRSYQP